MLEFEKKIIEVKFDGEVFELRRCSTSLAKDMFKKMKKLDTEKDSDQLIELQTDILEKCGAPKKLIEALDFEQFAILANEVMGLKKS